MTEAGEQERPPFLTHESMLLLYKQLQFENDQLEQLFTILDDQESSFEAIADAVMAQFQNIFGVSLNLYKSLLDDVLSRSQRIASLYTMYKMYASVPITRHPFLIVFLDMLLEDHQFHVEHHERVLVTSFIQPVIPVMHNPNEKSHDLSGSILPLDHIHKITPNSLLSTFIKQKNDNFKIPPVNDIKNRVLKLHDLRSPHALMGLNTFLIDKMEQSVGLRTDQEHIPEISYDLLCEQFLPPFIRPLPYQLPVTTSDMDFLVPMTMSLDYLYSRNDAHDIEQAKINEAIISLVKKAHEHKLSASEFEALEGYVKPTTIHQLGITVGNFPYLVEKNPNLAAIILIVLNDLPVFADFFRILNRMKHINLKTNVFATIFHYFNNLKDAIDFPPKNLITLLLLNQVDGFFSGIDAEQNFRHYKIFVKIIKNIMLKSDWTVSDDKLKASLARLCEQFPDCSETTELLSFL
ncbi:hypothetical protein PCE1_002125 [Barthelona sp. PCE]